MEVFVSSFQYLWLLESFLVILAKTSNITLIQNVICKNTNFPVLSQAAKSESLGGKAKNLYFSSIFQIISYSQCRTGNK